MYIICSRCQFRVPANRHVCHICGNSDLKSISSEKEQSATTNTAIDHVVQVCRRALQNCKGTFGLLSGRLFTRRHREEAALTSEPVDYLTAYKASIRNLDQDCTAKLNNGLRTSELKRKVELLDESCVTRHRIEELVHWFEEFGKDGIIVVREQGTPLSDAA
jgi:ribosomal protein L40E